MWLHFTLCMLSFAIAKICLHVFESKAYTRSDYMAHMFCWTTDLKHDYILTEDFVKNHFLVGLLLTEVKTALNEIQDIRKFAITTLRNLLAKHSVDDRYSSKVFIITVNHEFNYSSANSVPNNFCLVHPFHYVSECSTILSTKLKRCILNNVDVMQWNVIWTVDWSVLSSLL